MERLIFKILLKNPRCNILKSKGLAVFFLFQKRFSSLGEKRKFAARFEKLAHGVTGNTSDFGSEESRFEPWWANWEAPILHRVGAFLYPNERRARSLSRFLREALVGQLGSPDSA